jgi:hypothetical protein
MIEVNRRGVWGRYTTRLPAGGEALGTVKHQNVWGALVKCGTQFYKVTAGMRIELPARDVSAALLGNRGISA